MTAEADRGRDNDEPSGDRLHGHARLAVALILLGALAVRLWGIRYGLPHLYNWDEPTVVNRAVRFGSGDLNPHFFYYPTLWMYVLFILLGGYFAVGRITGHFHSAQDFAFEYFTRPTNAYLIARVATALVGTLTVYLVYRLGARLWGRAVGCVAAAFLAVSVIHTAYSQQAVTDVPQTLLIVASLLACCNVALRKRMADYVIAGALIGLGMATKYLAALVVIPLVLAHFAHDPAKEADGSRRNSRLVVALGVVAIAFFVGAPYCVLDFRSFVRDYRTQAALSAGGSGISAGHYLSAVLPGDVGWPMLAFALAGAAMAIRQRGAALRVVLSFAIVYFLFVARYPKGFPRYMIPMEPVIALLAATAIVGAARKLLPSRLVRPAVVCAAIAVGAYPAWAVIGWNRLVAGQADPRTRALAWCNRHVPSHSTIAIQSLFDRTFLNVPVMTDRKLARLGDYLPPTGRLGAARRRVMDALSRGPVYCEVPFSTRQPVQAEYVLVSDRCGGLSAADEASWRPHLAARFVPDPVSLGRIPALSRGVLELPPAIQIYRWGAAASPGPAESRSDRAVEDGRPT